MFQKEKPEINKKNQSWTIILKTCYLCSLEKVDKKLFLIGSLLDKKFKEVLEKLQNSSSSKEESTATKVQSRKIDPTLVEVKISSNIELI